MLQHCTKIWILILLIICLGCQTIKYKAEPSPLITMKKVQSGENNFSHNFDADFYFMGFYPGTRTLNLTKIARENGAENGLTNVRIREEATFFNALYLLITIGIYAPRNIQIDGIKIVNAE